MLGDALFRRAALSSICVLTRAWLGGPVAHILEEMLVRLACAVVFSGEELLDRMARPSDDEDESLEKARTLTRSREAANSIVIRFE